MVVALDNQEDIQANNPVVILVNSQEAIQASPAVIIHHRQRQAFHQKLNACFLP